MKLSTAMIIASATGACAFAPSTKLASSTSLRMSEPMEDMPVEAVMEATSTMEETPVVVVAEPPKPTLPKMSQSMPFMERPPMLDGSMVGDVGFDPLGFAKSSEDLMNYREAEIKHGRLAMLAAAGWPLSELFDKSIANSFGLAPVVDATDRAPSVLNGGLGKISPVYWGVCLAMAAAIDVFGIMKSRAGNDEYFPGNFGFDPLGMYPKDEAGQKRMQLAEIKNGRLAMIAITAFCFQELVTQSAVVDATSVFFKPLPVVMHEYANSGYYIPPQ